MTAPHTHARLVPSALVRQQLIEAATAAFAADPSRLRFYRVGAASSWVPTIEDSDWNAIQRAVVLDGRVLGWCSASVDREALTVTQIGAVSFGYSLPYARALGEFMCSLRREFRAIRWTCVVGNPAAAGYRRWAERAGGGEVCRLLSYAIIDGRPVDAHLFQVPGEAA